MKKLLKKAAMLAMSVVLTVLPATSAFATVYTGNTFTDKIKQEFVNFILNRNTGNWGSYDCFALHDMDGNGIPEVLFGKRNEANYDDYGRPIYGYFAYFDVFMYGNSDFKKVGIISESRYLMKDKYSNALIAVYSQIDNQRTNVSLLSYYMNNHTVNANTALMRTEKNETYKNNVPITIDQYQLELYNYLGSYDELMIHDLFTPSVVYVGVYSYRQPIFTPQYGRKLLTSATLRTDWQYKFYEFLESMRGPMNTYYEHDEFLPLTRVNYDRFALHDFEDDGVPELLVSTRDGEHFGFDVYKYINREVTYIGSFDGYSKYISKLPDSRDVMAYDPVVSIFDFQSVKVVSYNALDNIGLRLTDIMTVKADQKNPAKTVYTVNNSVTTYEKYLNALLKRVNESQEIKTYDANIVPFDAILASWRPVEK